jgi:hypothetical protein
MDASNTKIMTVPDHSPLIGVAEESIGREIALSVERFASSGRVVIASNMFELRLCASRSKRDRP